VGLKKNFGVIHRYPPLSGVIDRDRARLLAVSTATLRAIPQRDWVIRSWSFELLSRQAHSGFAKLRRGKTACRLLKISKNRSSAIPPDAACHHGSRSLTLFPLCHEHFEKSRNFDGEIESACRRSASASAAVRFFPGF
jgi:hypothetical protein